MTADHMPAAQRGNSTRSNRIYAVLPIFLLGLLFLSPDHAVAQSPSELANVAGVASDKTGRDSAAVTSLQRQARNLLSNAESLRHLSQEQRKALSSAVGQSSPPGTDNLAETGMWLPNFSIKLNLAGEGDFQDRLTTRGELAYSIPMARPGNFILPVVGNISPIVAAVEAGSEEAEQGKQLDALRDSKDGIAIGLHPYYVWHDRNEANVAVNLQWLVLGKSNRMVARDSTKVTLGQLQSGAGITFGIGRKKDNRRPMSIATRFVYSSFSAQRYQTIFGTSRDHLWTLESDFLLPINDTGAGVLIQTLATKHLAPAWNAALVFTKAK